VQVRHTGSGPGGALSTWRLRLKGLSIAEGEVHVWSISARAAQFTGRAVRDSHKVGSPAAATRAVSVASYTTRNEWEDLLGNQQVAGLDEDDISDFSSEGPRRGGGPKPDLAAPGAMIVSSLSVHSPVEPSELIDDRHLVMAGTSMAAPFVSGLVALLLERDPKLEPETAKELLQAASAVPGRPAGAFDPKWGRGLVDAARLAQDP
ncbi:MAG: S8 family serine peptidase, partial [Acidimicrobiales bacterium]